MPVFTRREEERARSEHRASGRGRGRGREMDDTPHISANQNALAVVKRGAISRNLVHGETHSTTAVLRRCKLDYSSRMNASIISRTTRAWRSILNVEDNVKDNNTTHDSRQDLLRRKRSYSCWMKVRTAVGAENACAKARACGDGIVAAGVYAY